MAWVYFSPVTRSLAILAVLALLLIGFGGVVVWRYSGLWPGGSAEIVQLTPARAEALRRLRTESKFGPNDFPPLGYTGIATPEDGAAASAAVNDVIDRVLASPGGRVEARAVSASFGSAMNRVSMLETEDRDRTWGYLLEIWYRLGFRGATGRAFYGSAFQPPPGYAEPLPPGWTAPDRPRPIETPPA